MIMSGKPMNKVPVHVSMIMDGNGRWAKERGKERIYGHFEGVESVRACVEAAVETGVKYLSIYAFSEENWNRPQAEVDGLMELMVKAMAAEMEKLNRNGVRFMVIGNRERLAPSLNEVIDSCMAMTAANDTLTLKSTAKVKGDIQTSILDIEQRAEFNGTCTMGKETPAQPNPKNQKK